MTPQAYDALKRTARRVARADEADDLVQTALEIALARGRDPADAANLSWLKGVVRVQARATGRAAGRRRAGEAEAAALTPEQAQPGPDLAKPAPLLEGLPPALRRTAVLALSGFTRDELRHVLGISDAALRRRLSDLRLRLDGESPPEPEPSDLQLGRLRQALLKPVKHQGGLGAHDPDGHLFAVVLTNQRRRTTRDAANRGDTA
ncbi:hypothetical protein Q0812_03065 [Brevundimonas sp. 2R-24]|uniref:Sigma-70 family RNA polymerase sigma factor n=1 Tax=Peiella sedimenti TaxID=3061083 RepID=A0ABT8SIK0_9CAUL|nr:hypothetical protein [Caulobacteraceae bacterium XZ-24]